MIKRLRLAITDSAEVDLTEIYEYINANNSAAADAFIDDITEKLFNLAELGITGFPRDWISPGLRAFPYRDRCFYFRIIDDAMVVVRILHSKQDISSQNFPFN